MAVQPYPYIAISDGTTTVVFADGANGSTSYPIVRGGWAPQIPPLRASQLGGRGVYEEVVEEVDLQILGASAAAAMASLATLNGLLDQAERFWRFGEGVSPVVFQYAPQGSTIASSAAPYQALILGRAPGDESRSPIILPSSFTDVGMIRAILGVKLRFWRRGPLIGQDAANTSGSGSNPAKLTATFAASAAASSPAKVDLGGFATTTVPSFPASYLLIAPSAAAISIIDPTSWTGADYSAVNDSTHKPYNGTNALRYGGSKINIGQTAGTGVDAAFTNAKRVQFLAVVRNNSPTTTFQIRANLVAGGATYPTAYQTIDTSSSNPQIVNLGLAVAPIAASGFSITIASSSGDSAQTLDISHLIALNVTDERARAIPLDALTVSLSAGSYTVTIDDQILTAEAPLVKLAGASSSLQLLGYHADAMLATSGTTMTAVWLAVGGFTANRWRFTNASDTILTNTLTATRHTAYLTPQ